VIAFSAPEMNAIHIRSEAVAKRQCEHYVPVFNGKAPGKDGICS